eukprot:CFRG8148T1
MVDSKRFVTEASSVYPIQLGSDVESDGLPAQTFWHAYNQILELCGDKPAMTAFHHTEKDTNSFYTSKSDQTWSHKETFAEAQRFAQALVASGFPMYKSVNIIGFNSFEWMCADLGCMMASGLSAGVYPTASDEGCQYQAAHSEAHTVVVEGKKQLSKYQQILESRLNDGLPDLKVIVVFNLSAEDVAAEKELFNKHHVNVYEWSEFLAIDKENNHLAEVERRRNAQVPGNCLKLIYTSGTTGNPKAVMISHDNLVWTTRIIYKSLYSFSYHDRIVSYLPLSHIAAQIIDFSFCCVLGVHVFFARPDALKGTLNQTLLRVQPTIFLGVPRVWEKIVAKLKALMAESSGLKSKITNWAMSVGEAYNASREGFTADGMPKYNNPSGGLGYSVASMLVFSKVKAALGLSQCRLMASGAAPISSDTVNMLASLDIPIIEVYGQSECCGAATYTGPTIGWMRNTVGLAMLGTNLRIDPNTEEIQYSGRHLFMGYLKMKEKTRNTLTDDGWLASGDQGKISRDGFLSITGRIKELIIGAGGENVAPLLIEKAMKQAMPFLSNCIVFGDGRPYLGMFVSLCVLVDENTMRPIDTLDGVSLEYAKRIGSTATTYSAAKECPKIAEAVDAGMKKGAEHVISNAAKPRFWTWLPEDLSMSTDTLGPTLKMKRNVVYKLYEEDIDSGYKSNDAKFQSLTGNK